MNCFNYKNGTLYCESVSIADIAEKVGTPFYIYSSEMISSRYKQLDEAFSNIDHQICYSIKANSNLSICKKLAKLGAGADIVSGGELYRALKAGFKPEKIVFAGVGKSPTEMEYGLKANVSMFNVESLAEAELLNEIAKKLGKRAKIALRINPDISLPTHEYILTGKKETKFGIPLSDAYDTFLKVAKMPYLEVIGLHFHIGSQILSPDPYVKAIRRVKPLIQKLRSAGIQVSILNIGGGMGIVYRKDREKPIKIKPFAKAIISEVKDLNCKLLLEPGRYLVGESGVLVTKILFVKNAKEKTFFVVDASMTDLIRPALYDAYHEIIPVKKSKSNNRKILVDIVGPVCESSDFFAKNRKMPASLQAGDLLAILCAGAYGFSMSSNYNSRPRCAEVLVENSKYKIIRRRETYEDLVALEI